MQPIAAPSVGQLDIWWETLGSSAESLRPKGARGILEGVLARYGHFAPLVRDDHGKPRSTDTRGLTFNLSHSGDRAVVAVSTVAAVGVDCESVRPIDDFLAVAELTFSPPERAHLAALPPLDRLLKFYSLWTRKEAVAKGIGLGLAYPLVDLPVLAPHEHVPFPVEAPGQGTWWVCSIPAANGFIAACASQRPFEVRYRSDLNGRPISNVFD